MHVINWPTAWYKLSDAFWLDATQVFTWSHSLNGSKPPKYRPFTLSDVTFPARKSLLAEQLSFCHADAVDIAFAEKHRYSRLDAPIVFVAVDGSARRVTPSINANGLGSPFGGVHGVDW